MKKPNIPQQVFKLYDDYAHNRLSRRSFLDKVSVFAVGGLTLPAILGSVLPNYEDTLQIAPDDDRLRTEYISYDSPRGGGTMKGLLAQPNAETGKLPGILVVHENRGLNPHIEDVGRRAALGGFISLSPDALTPLGGYPGNDDDGRALQRQRDREEMLQDFIAGFEYLKSHPACTGKVGVVGFCFGGWISNSMAARVPELGAAVPFYGSAAPTEEVPNIQTPLLLQFAGLDERVNGSFPEYVAALMEHDKTFTAHLYAGVNHGFHNDSTARYDFDAAQLAWQRTMAFFGRHLK